MVDRWEREMLSGGYRVHSCETCSKKCASDHRPHAHGPLCHFGKSVALLLSGVLGVFFFLGFSDFDWYWLWHFYFVASNWPFQYYI